ncbi:hypothetical protein [uncultured Aquimarina sp.]|uniref:XAC2610-related protein n=1 Tax=uncultured Aquimarina sp. TaxID=575652 RepID=UPI00261421BA|nr:hypothetical protein [uncultured Aquimarina sp.]
MKFLPIITFLASISLFSQTEYFIEDFSDEYYGKVYVNQGFENEVFKQGKIIIYKKKTKKEIIKINSEELAFEHNEKGAIKTNTLQLPYGEQSVLIYEDFNFDNIKDLAIQDGQFSCYHGPSYQIYLGKTNGFTHSPEFTQLAQEYCGMFQVDYETKKIFTRTKSGCCWHQFSEYIIENDLPKVILISEEGSGMSTTGYTFDTVEKRWNGSIMVKTVSKKLLIEDIEESILLRFLLEKNSKEVVLFTSEIDKLNYVFTNKDGEIEFDYAVENSDPTFTLSETNTEISLTFKNLDATYKIYKNKNDHSMWISVTIGTKSYYNKADAESIQGKLSVLKSKNLRNVTN